MLKLGILILVTILNFSLGLLVLAKNPRHWVNRSFAIFALSVAGWSASLATKLVGTEPALFWARLSFLMAGTSVLALVLFFQTFPFRASLPRSRVSAALAAFWALIAGLSMLSPWIVESAVNTPTGRTLLYGPLYRLFAIYIFCCVGYSFVLIITRLRTAKSAERQQLIYLFLALLLPGCLAIATNLIVPLALGTSHLSTYGPLFSVVMLGMIAHAIIRYRFLNVRLVVRRGVVYLIAAGIAATAITISLFLADRLTGGRAGDAPPEVQVGVALLVALAFHPLKNRVQRWLDQYVYRESYDYQRTIRDATRTIASMLDLKPLLAYLCEMIARTFRPDLVAVFIRDGSSGTFELAAKKTFGESEHISQHSLLPPDSPIAQSLARSRRHLSLDELLDDVSNEQHGRAASHLSQLGGQLALPMLSENQLIGFIVLGPKLSGDLYFPDDVELLSTLSNQAAIAVKNAQLYREVVLVNEYIENILSTMDSGVITVDANGRVALCNATAERLTGIPRPFLTSLTVERLPTSIATPLRATLADGQSRSQVESTLATEDDPRIPIVCSTSALADDRGGIAGALVVFSDLSQVKALENEKRRAERLAAFGTLVSGIAHEIKNPLVAIRTFAELLPERFTEPDFREDFAKVVTTEIDRIDGLVARLRGLAAPSIRQIAGTDIREPLKETLALLRGQFEQTQTSVHREFTDPAPFVAVDPAQLKQLFLNIFLNAIEAMGHGGSLTVRVRRKDAIGTSLVAVEVVDSGPGIPDSIRNSIFDPFFTTKPRGTGLGLAICRGITDAHRGTITAEANRGSTGTTIVVEFPVASDTLEPVQQDALSR